MFDAVAVSAAAADSVNFQKILTFSSIKRDATSSNHHCPPAATVRARILISFLSVLFRE